MAGRAERPSAVGGLAERPARLHHVAGLGLRVAARQQELAAACGVAARLPERGQRDLVVARRLLVRHLGGRLAGGALGVLDGLGGAARRRREAEVVRELGQRRLGAVRLQALERLADPQVQPRPPHPGQPVVERLADQRVGEAAAAVHAGDLGDDVCADALLDHLVERVLVVRLERLEQLDAELAADHRRGRQHVARGVRQRRQPPLDDLADPLGELVRPRRAVALAAPAGAEVPDHLLEEERVALGLLEQRAVDVLGQRVGAELADQLGRVRLVEARAARSPPGTARGGAGTRMSTSPGGRSVSR